MLLQARSVRAYRGSAVAPLVVTLALICFKKASERLDVSPTSRKLLLKKCYGLIERPSGGAACPGVSKVMPLPASIVKFPVGFLFEGIES